MARRLPGRCWSSVEIAGGEDELRAWLTGGEAVGDGEAEAAGASGDDDDRVALAARRLEGAGCADGETVSERRRKDGAGFCGVAVEERQAADGFMSWSLFSDGCDGDARESVREG